MTTDAERERCECGHLKSAHDYFGCTYASCMDTCRRRWGSDEGKPERPAGGAATRKEHE